MKSSNVCFKLIIYEGSTSEKHFEQKRMNKCDTINVWLVLTKRKKLKFVNIKAANSFVTGV